MSLLATISSRAKAVVAALPLIGLVITEAAQALDNGAADGTFDMPQDLIALVIAAVTPLIVYVKANTTADPAVAQAQSVVYRP